MSPDSEPPFTVSAAARAALAQAIEKSTRKVVRILPLGAGTGGLGFSLSLTASAQSSDLTFEEEGLTYCVDRASIALFADITIDFDERGASGSFVFRSATQTAAS